MEHVVKRKGTVTCEGVTLAEWNIFLPYCGECSFMKQFYEELAEGVEKDFCQGSLQERAQREYGECEDPLKRFHFGAFRYSLTGKICYESDLLCSVRLDASLCRRGNRALRSIGMDAHTWEKESGMLLPPQEILRQMNEPPLRKEERRVTRAVLATRQGILLFDGVSFWKREEKEE